MMVMVGGEGGRKEEEVKGKVKMKSFTFVARMLAKRIFRAVQSKAKQSKASKPFPLLFFGDGRVQCLSLSPPLIIIPKRPCNFPYIRYHV